jgi:hypothetical protein
VVTIKLYIKPLGALRNTLRQALAVAALPAMFAALEPSVSASRLLTPAECSKAEARSNPSSQTPASGVQEPKPLYTLVVNVADENRVPVASARVTLSQGAKQIAYRCETDHFGRCEIGVNEPGLYQLGAEKEGFYSAVLDGVRAGEAQSVDVTLYHQQEYAEVVNVYDSPQAIDPQRTEASQTLSNREIINLPYPSTRDVRNALPLIPGVVQDPTGQVHINGSVSSQIFSQLDGFNITHPTTGLLEMRVSTDAVRSIDVKSSRYSAEFGKGSGGVLSLTTGMGDDHYRFSATDFIPSLQTRKGIGIDGWTPRATFSGPLRKKKAWFYDAIDGEYELRIIDELPVGADRSPTWRGSNLAKAQINLNQRNILTGSFLANYFQSGNAGLSRFNPPETTYNYKQTAYLLTVKDQSYFASGLLLEAGFAASQFGAREQPHGSLPLLIRPAGTSGNFFRMTDTRARRLQGIVNLTLPAARWHGQHEFRLGLDTERITYTQLSERRPLLIFRENGALARRVEFINNPRARRNNLAVSVFAQDRWLISERLLVEMGLRLDWDQIIRRALVSPRSAFSYLLTHDGETKISAGIGLYYDATNIDLITRPLVGQRFDYFYAPDGRTLAAPPVETSFLVNERELRAPRFLNWSAGLERKLPASIYLAVEFVQKRGRDGFVFVNQGLAGAGRLNLRYALRSERRNSYDGVGITVRRSFAGGYAVLASYTRSAARSNTAVSVSFDNPIFSPQGSGPLPWDTPNRFITWGWLPLIKKFDFSYSLEWRDGYPFSLVNQEQRLVGAPNARRFPAYFSLNTHVERRFRLLGLQLALRAGFNNVTGRRNPTEVNNNVDSPQFLTFGGTQHRVFTGRIRFLGRK